MQNNYSIQAQQAKQYFLAYDQQALIRKHSLKSDDSYLYLTFLSESCRISRRTGDIDCFRRGSWQGSRSHGFIMTILDLICDSREDRHPSGILKNMQDFGHQFHRELGEKNPDAHFFEKHPQKLKQACEALGGISFPQGDIAYTIPLFEDLSITLQLWLGDEEFPARLRYLWDENALQYLKYETMYYGADALSERIKSYF